ncbi:DUF1254 domain-containing protein [Sphingomonas sp. Ag1]|uniref:DUF1254 domain-containing protein n=1 Tax=Sphingomonas sp. Ag1 TaxID=1642949 RepID=UPI0009E65A53|nr:DUF1254 domain-containing protein [Sphingomonas sp. Ag1]
MLNRRSLLVKGSLGAVGLPLLGSPVWAAAGDLSPLAAASRDAWLYGLVLIEMAGSRAETLGSVAPNRIFHARALTTPETQRVTTPNNDTLYSRSWINLNAGPVRVTLPRTGKRYLSVAFMDMYSNNFALLGTRTTGGDGGTFTLVGPNAATTDPLAIRAPTPWVWMLSRLLVDGDADLAAANAIHGQLKLDAPAAPAPAKFATRAAPWNEYFDSVQRLIVENPPPVTDDLLFERIAPLGLGPKGGFNPNRFSADQRREIEAGIAAARTSLKSTRRQGQVIDGWVFPKLTLGDFGQDYFYRAQVSLGGLAALPRAEAMYMRPLSERGTVTFDSSENWKLTLPADRLPPVDAFWSMTMYRATNDGQYFFFDNPINRYAIGNRTAGLRKDADGGLTIWMSRNDPGAERRANWLPLPSEGPFAPVFRAYMPKPEFVDGDYHLPAMTRA